MHILWTHLEKVDTSEAITHYESTPFNAKPMEFKEEPDNLVFPNVFATAAAAVAKTASIQCKSNNSIQCYDGVQCLGRVSCLLFKKEKVKQWWTEHQLCILPISSFNIGPTT